MRNKALTARHGDLPGRPQLRRLDRRTSAFCDVGCSGNFSAKTSAAAVDRYAEHRSVGQACWSSGSSFSGMSRPRLRSSIAVKDRAVG